jgi:hypothetical protein
MSRVSLEGLSSEQIADLAALAKAQLDDPNVRPYFLRNQKVVDPSLSIPEVDIPMQAQGLIAGQQKQIETLQQQLNEDRIRREINERRSALQTKHGLSSKDVEEVEKLMLEKQIGSHDTAAEFYKSQQQSAQPTPSTFAPNSLPKIDLKGTGTTNMNQWARAQAGQVIDEFRGRIKVG